jgi:TRAP-type mannitol/chloroaromatic compound transport system substrate-binding protein
LSEKGAAAQATKGEFTMRRRAFVQGGGLGIAAAAIASPSIAQSMPEIEWRLASSYPTSLDTIYGGSAFLAKRLAEATDNKFRIRVFAAGEIVPAFGVLDAVQNKTVELAHTSSYYFVGKDPTFTFDCTMPFGFNVRQQNAWMWHGGGRELIRDFFKDYSVYPIPAGNTGAQMGGWFNKEIRVPEDLRGLKFRIGGWAGSVLAKLGVLPKALPGGEIYPALEKGTIDAAEWIGPYDDEKLGLNKIAKYYYYPGWWEGNAQQSIYVNIDRWNSLPRSYQVLLELACAETANWMAGKYDAENPAALRRLVGGGTQLRPFPSAVLEACFKAALELYDETAAANPRFKKIYEPWKRFLADEELWFQVAEHPFDSFMARHPYDKRL